MGTITNEIKSSFGDETVTIPKEKYERLLGEKLVYPIGQKLVSKILNNTGISNIEITGHATDVKGHPIYKMKSYGWYDGSHIEQDNGEYFTTEYGLKDYVPVAKWLKLIENDI